MVLRKGWCRTRWMFGVVAATIVSSSASGRAASVEVRLREQATPATSVVRLADVGDIVTADASQRAVLAAVPLMPAPATTRHLREREVADMLAAHGVDLSAVRFTGAPGVAVLPTARKQSVVQPIAAVSELDPSRSHREAILNGSSCTSTAPPADEVLVADIRQRLVQVATDYLKQQSGKEALGQVDLKLTDAQVAEVAEAISLPTFSGGASPWTGRQRLTLSFVTPKGTSQSLVPVEVAQAAEPHVVARRAVPRGVIVTAADVEVRSLVPDPRHNGPQAPFRALEEVIGKETRQPLEADQTVTTNHIQSPTLVKRGESITVTSQAGGIRVRTNAKALQDGALGELVRVETPENKQQFDVRVVAMREAAVYSPATPAVTKQPRTFPTPVASNVRLAEERGSGRGNWKPAPAKGE
ncbi:MAG: flagellar basal body P-ring formation protein FlgA [Pirellulales bacterium]|nr:flagellar basal body P-ring formation protein FlgA [Pirellulales bacterium]